MWGMLGGGVAKYFFRGRNSHQVLVRSPLNKNIGRDRLELGEGQKGVYVLFGGSAVVRKGTTYKSPVPNMSTLTILIRQGKSSGDPQNEFPRIPRISLLPGIRLFANRKPRVSRNFPALPLRGLVGPGIAFLGEDEVEMLGSGGTLKKIPENPGQSELFVCLFWAFGGVIC